MMINKDSIVTAYDEHLTLVEWLQKVETALKDAVLTGVTINKKGNATLSFVFTFEDGTTLETDDLILQQGESVQSATIRNNHLILTLTNGDELDAGNMFNGNVVINGSVSTPILTSQNDHIEAQKPVIETMTGYNHSGGHKDVTSYYAGISKNGNKLSVVIAGSITPSESGGYVNTLLSTGTFDIPAEVGAKIVTQLQDRIIGNELLLTSNTNQSTTSKRASLYVTKWSNTSITLYIAPMEALEEGVTYHFRQSMTFLLSDNLANNG